jgi:hypothetical protein
MLPSSFHIDLRESDDPEIFMYYRISSPVKDKITDGTINDSRVRLRVQPNLNSETWGYLNRGTKVKILDRSKIKQKIEDMEDYWYKVDVEGKPDGWVYGAYIDITED